MCVHYAPRYRVLHYLVEWYRADGRPGSSSTEGGLGRVSRRGDAGGTATGVACGWRGWRGSGVHHEFHHSRPLRDCKLAKFVRKFPVAGHARRTRRSSRPAAGGGRRTEARDGAIDELTA